MKLTKRNRAPKILSFSKKVLPIIVLTSLTLFTILHRSMVLGIRENLRKNARSNIFGTTFSRTQYSDDQITIVIMTYQRTDILLQNPFFTEILPLDIVAQVQIIWNDVYDTSGLERVRAHFQELNFEHKLQTHVPEVNSMNNRFMPSPKLATNAVLIMDDEWRMEPTDFVQAFRAWQRTPFRLIGFVPRLIEYNPRTRSSEYNFFPDKGFTKTVQTRPFNIVLPGFMMHRQYLELYSSDIPRVIQAREYVDKVFNCDDILINFLIPPSYHPPILVSVGDEESGPFVRPEIGISRGSQHYQKRLLCIKYFAELFGWPFIQTHELIDNPIKDIRQHLQ